VAEKNNTNGIKDGRTIKSNEKDDTFIIIGVQ
jgi:hypothetical protein